MQGLWISHEASNLGTTQLLQGADATVKQLKPHVEEAEKDMEQMETDANAQVLQLASVAAGLKGLAFDTPLVAPTVISHGSSRAQRHSPVSHLAPNLSLPVMPGL